MKHYHQRGLRLDVKFEPHWCSCGEKLSGGHHFGEPEVRPQVGQIAFCGECFALYRWDADERLHPFTEADYVEAKKDHYKWFTLQMIIAEEKRKKYKY